MGRNGQLQGDRPRRQPRRRSRRATIARTLLVAAVALPVLSACSASFSAQTYQEYQPAAGISDRRSEVFVLNAMVVADTSGNGTLIGTLINQNENHDDAITAVEAKDPNNKQIDVSGLSVPIALPSQQAVNLAIDGQIRLTSDLVTPGGFLTVVWSFEQAAPVTMVIPIVPPGDLYTDVPVGPAPTS